MSWDAYFIATEGKLPTEQEMIDKGIKIISNENGKFYYVEYEDNNEIDKSGFYIHMYENYWYGTISYGNKVKYFGKWLWDNFKVFYIDDTDITFTERNFNASFGDIWDKIEEEDKEIISNYNTYYQVLYNGVADENDITLKKIYVEDDIIKSLQIKYNI